MFRSILFFAAIALFLPQCSGKPPASIGLVDGENMLSPCPASPNCVSSQSQDEKHAIAPLSYTGSFPDARHALVAVIKKQKRSRIITETPVYIHAEFTSALFRFVDDVEFLFDDANKIIHCRSASRTGYSDFGVNRRRIEMIRDAFTDHMDKQERGKSRGLTKQ